MKKISSKWWIASGLAVTVIVFSAWRPGSGTQNISVQYEENDTTPSRKKNHYRYRNEISTGDLEEAMKGLDKAMSEMERSMKMDFSKMDKEMKIAMDGLKNIDFEKLAKEIELSLKEINWDKTRVDVDKALREAEIKIKDLDLKKMKEEMAEVKVEMEKNHHLNIDMSKLMSGVESGLAAAKLGMEGARKELQLLKEFIDTLEKDGLIDKKKGFKIQIKDGELFINGTKQSKEVNDKYRKYIKDREDFTITEDEEGTTRI
jgi:hypothetical protein